MTRDEAQRAAATFEFPGFRCEAVRWDWLLSGGDSIEDWMLQVTCGTTQYFGSTDAWLAYYAEWQRTHGSQERGETRGSTS